VPSGYGSLPKETWRIFDLSLRFLMEREPEATSTKKTCRSSIEKKSGLSVVICLLPMLVVDGMST
jgi:hypothetical protein